MKTMLAIACLLTAPTTMAEVYKCKNTSGRVEFQATPCADSKTGVIVNLKIQENTARTQTPNSKSTATAADGNSEKEKAEQAFRTRHRLRAIDDEIDNLQSQIRIFSMRMEKEMVDLRESKTSSNNNLAGETRNLAISSEMTAVATQYTNKIKVLEVQLETLRQERSKLQK